MNEKSVSFPKIPPEGTRGNQREPEGTRGNQRGTVSVDFAPENLKTILNIYKDGGKFYRARGIDAYILNYIFDYKVINGKCGFPDNIIERVLIKLEEEKISYEINYCDRNSKSRRFKYNNYLRFHEKALKKMEISEKIELIEKKLNNANIKELERILDIINANL